MQQDPAVSEQRIDKWLWHARIVKTRTLAGKLATSGQVRLNRTRVTRASQMVRPGDVVTVPQGRLVRVLKVAGFSSRRGTAAEAQALFEDMAPENQAGAQPNGEASDRSRPAGPAGVRPAGSGRPTKRERRALDKLTKTDL